MVALLPHNDKDFSYGILLQSASSAAASTPEHARCDISQAPSSAPRSPCHDVSQVSSVSGLTLHDIFQALSSASASTRRDVSDALLSASPITHTSGRDYHSQCEAQKSYKATLLDRSLTLSSSEGTASSTKRRRTTRFGQLDYTDAPSDPSQSECEEPGTSGSGSDNV